MRDGTNPSAGHEPADQAFAHLWRAGGRPDTRTFLSSRDDLSTTMLLAVLRVDQRERWRARQPLDVHAYLREHPRLAQDPEARFELIYHEMLLREELGDRPDPAEYARAFPELADRLRMQLEVHQAFSADETDEDTPTDPDDLGPVLDLPGYEVLNELGRGGMGVVYRARQLEPNRLVALKMVLHGPFADPSDLRRFRHEAEVIASLDHPNIVPILEMGRHGRLRYFTMRLITGGSLADRPTFLRDDPRRAAWMMAEIADAVYHAHRRGVLHRDLKPANILLDEDGRPHVTDFGLAKRTSGPNGLTRSGWMMGSPGYMAPEQAHGDPARITTAADVYGLGAILYAMLTGRAPFVGASAQDTIDRLRHEPAEPPSRHNPNVPRPLDWVCLKCLEKDPARRYPTAEALGEDLRRWLTGRPVTARSVGALTRARLWVARRPGLAALAGSLVLAVVAGFLGVAWQWQRAERNLSEAVHERGRSELALAKAERANLELKEAKARESAARERAEQRFLLALDAIQGFYAQPEDWVMMAQKDPDALRRELTKRAECYYRKLQESLESDRSPQSQAQLAAAFEQVAQIGSDLGALELALSAHDRAIETRRQLLEAEPASANRLRELIRSWLDRGLSARGHTRYDVARETFEEARAFLDRELARRPDNEVALELLGWAVGNIAAVQLLSGDAAEGLRNHQRVLAIREELQTLRPDVVGHQLDHAWVLLDIGLAHRALGALDDSAANMERAVAECEDALTKGAAPADALRRLVACHRELAQTYVQQGRLAEGRDHDRRACEAGERMLSLAPENVRALEVLASSCKAKGEHELEDQDEAAARRSFARAVELHEGLVQRRPGSLRLREDLAYCRHRLGTLCRALGDLTGAAESLRKGIQERLTLTRAAPSPKEKERHLVQLADDRVHLALALVQSGTLNEAGANVLAAEKALEQFTQRTPHLLYNLACVHALMAPRLRAPWRRADIEKDYLDRAATYLRRSVDAGYADLEWLEKDRDLDPLHDHPGYRAVVWDLRFPADPFAREAAGE